MKGGPMNSSGEEGANLNRSFSADSNHPGNSIASGVIGTAIAGAAPAIRVQRRNPCFLSSGSPGTTASSATQGDPSISPWGRKAAARKCSGRSLRAPHLPGCGTYPLTAGSPAQSSSSESLP